MNNDFDVIIIGARCAGSPTAMLLARKGFKVLVVDRATFPSDTISNHVLHPHGAAALARWGLLDRLVATGCPPIETYSFDLGPIRIVGRPGTAEAPFGYCPRRIVLDKLLVDAAAEAGADVREAFIVDDLLHSDGQVTGIRGHRKDGPIVEIRAPLVIGADGRHSVVADAVAAEVYNERPTTQVVYYAYWSNLPTRGDFGVYLRERCGCGLVETHDGLTCAFVGWPVAEQAAVKRDLEGRYRAIFEQVPSLRARMSAARLESKIYGAPTPNFFRKPFGPGWALVGDAGYIKDPCTAQGIVNAFRDAELVTDAVEAWRGGSQTYDAAMASFQAKRDRESLPLFDFTCQMATLEPPPPDMQHLLAAVSRSQRAMDDFTRVIAGTVSPLDFFSEDNVGRMLAAAS